MIHPFESNGKYRSNKWRNVLMFVDRVIWARDGIVRMRVHFYTTRGTVLAQKSRPIIIHRREFESWERVG